MRFGREVNNLTPDKTALFTNLIEAKTGLIFWSDAGEGKGLEDTCKQKRGLEDGREGGQGPTRNVEPWNNSSSYRIQ